MLLLLPCGVSRGVPHAGAFFAVYSASLYQIERARKGKRSLVRGTHTAAASRSSLAQTAPVRSAHARQANSLLAGCLTGAVFAVHTRKGPVIALSSAIGSVLALGVDGTGALVDAVLRK